MADHSKEDLNRRMEEIRKKNELLMIRRREVLADQRQAEESGASITNILKTQKSARQSSDSDTEEKVSSYPVSNAHERAWDKGKKLGNDVDYEEKENPSEHGGWTSWKSYNRDKRRGRGNFDRGNYHGYCSTRGNKQGYFSSNKPVKTFISTSAKQESRGSYSGKEWKPKFEGDSRAPSWQSRNQRAQFRGRGKSDNEMYQSTNYSQPISRRGDSRRPAGGSWRRRYQDQSAATWNTVQEKESNVWQNNEAIKGQSNAWSDLSDSEDNHVPDLKMQKFLSDVEKYSTLRNNEDASDEEIAVSYEAEKYNKVNSSKQKSQIDLAEDNKNEDKALGNSVADDGIKVFQEFNSVEEEKAGSRQNVQLKVDLSDLDRKNENDSSLCVSALGNDAGHCIASQDVSKEKCSSVGGKNQVESMLLTESSINYEKETVSVLEKNDDILSEQTKMHNFGLVSQSETRPNVQSTKQALTEDIENDKRFSDFSLFASGNQISDSHTCENEISHSFAKSASSFNIKDGIDCSDEQELQEKQITSSHNQNNLNDCEIISSVMNDDDINGQGEKTFLHEDSSEKDLDNNAQNEIWASSEAPESQSCDAVDSVSVGTCEKTGSTLYAEAAGSTLYAETTDSTLCDNPEAADKTLFNAPEAADKTLCDAPEAADSTLCDAPEAADSTLCDAPEAADSTLCDAPEAADSTLCDAPEAADSTLCDAPEAADKTLCNAPEAADKTLCNASEEDDSTLHDAPEAAVSTLCNDPKAADSTLHDAPEAADSTLHDAPEAVDSTLHDASEAVDSTLLDASEAVDSTLRDAPEASHLASCDAPKAADSILCNISEATGFTSCDLIKNTSSPSLFDASNASSPPLCDAANASSPPLFDASNASSPPLCDASNASSPPLCDASNASNPPLCDVDKLSKDTSYLVDDASMVTEVDEEMEKL